MLPESLDLDTLRTVAIVALVALLIVAFLVMRFIQKMVLRVVLIGALAGIGLFVWAQRQELSECVPQCDCTFFGFEVAPENLPGCRPAES